jgi:hypothetical protein
VFYLPLETYGPNRSIKRIGQALINKTIALKLDSNLPDNIIPEYYIVVGYILNRSLIARIEFQSLLEGFMQDRSIVKWKPNVVYMFRFGCKTYAYDLKKDLLDKLEPKVYIGWLVGYKSTNI